MTLIFNNIINIDQLSEIPDIASVVTTARTFCPRPEQPLGPLAPGQPVQFCVKWPLQIIEGCIMAMVPEISPLISMIHPIRATLGFWDEKAKRSYRCNEVLWFRIKLQDE